MAPGSSIPGADQEQVAEAARTGARARDEEYMRRVLAEASRGAGRTSPNPMVGVVLVKDDAIVAVGHHERAGRPHAEQVALRRAGEAARGAELYVNLEPCCHHGRTEPCTNAIAHAGVRRVVAGVIDPNPLVSGKGLAALVEAGVEVECGVLEAECTRLNAPFFKYIRSGLPFVTAKYAMTLDGKIATRRGDSRWISNERSRREVHRLRNLHDAVLVGARTLVRDNPSLTTRGIPASRDPIRVVVDPHGRIAGDAQVLTQQSEAPTWVVCRSEVAESLRSRLEAPHQVIPLEPEPSGGLPLRQLLLELGRREVMTLLVEGGGETLGSLFAENLVDRVVAFVAPKLVGGRTAPTPIDGKGVATMSMSRALMDLQVERLGDDVMLSGWVVHRTADEEQAAPAEPEAEAAR